MTPKRHVEEPKKSVFHNNLFECGYDGSAAASELISKASTNFSSQLLVLSVSQSGCFSPSYLPPLLVMESTQTVIPIANTVHWKLARWMSWGSEEPERSSSAVRLSAAGNSPVGYWLCLLVTGSVSGDYVQQKCQSKKHILYTKFWLSLTLKQGEI